MSSGVTNKLTKISITDLPKLRDLYKLDWPKHHIAYNSLQNYIDWYTKNVEIKNFEIFTLNDDWTDGTYVILDRYSVLSNTLSDNLENLTIALDLLDKSKYYFLFGITEHIQPAFEKWFNINKWPYDPEENITIWYRLERKYIQQFEIKPPEGIVLKRLNEDNSTIINEIWPYHHPGSQNFIKRLIRYNYSIGAFKIDSGELIAWCLISNLGALALLQVKDDYKKQGFGSLVVKAMSKYYYDRGEDVTAPVLANNIASRNMFKKLGFKEFGKLNVFFTKAANPSYIWNEKDDE